MDLKRRVKEMLFELEMSMKDFALQLEISPSYLSYILDDKRKAFYYRTLIEDIVKKFERERSKKFNRTNIM